MVTLRYDNIYLELMTSRRECVSSDVPRVRRPKNEAIAGILVITIRSEIEPFILTLNELEQ